MSSDPTSHVYISCPSPLQFLHSSLLFFISLTPPSVCLNGNGNCVVIQSVIVVVVNGNDTCAEVRTALLAGLSKAFSDGSFLSHIN